jgi:glutamyl/glutaminyl-tRNA synthetase
VFSSCATRTLTQAVRAPNSLEAMIEDLRWFGFRWQEGPDCGGPYAPYAQSERLDSYQAGFEKLKKQGRVYPCYCSRQDVLRALASASRRRGRTGLSRCLPAAG